MIGRLKTANYLPESTVKFLKIRDKNANELKKKLWMRRLYY